MYVRNQRKRWTSNNNWNVKWMNGRPRRGGGDDRDWWGGIRLSCTTRLSAKCLWAPTIIKWIKTTYKQSMAIELTHHNHCDSFSAWHCSYLASMKRKKYAFNVNVECKSDWLIKNRWTKNGFIMNNLLPNAARSSKRCKMPTVSKAIAKSTAPRQPKRNKTKNEERPQPIHSNSWKIYKTQI